MEQPTNSMWIRAFTPDGYQVSFTLLLPPDDPIGFANLIMQEVAKYGYLPRESALDPGEQLVTVNQVLRREHVNGKTGEVTPVVEFWNAHSKYRTVQYYLNTDEDIATFVNATGHGLKDYPLYEGEGSVERGKSPKAEAKLVNIQPIQIVMKTVEKEVDGAIQKRKYFVRFYGMTAPVIESVPTAKEVQDKLGSGSQRRIPASEQQSMLAYNYDTVHKMLKATGTFNSDKHIANAIKEQRDNGRLPREATNEQAYEIVMSRNEVSEK